MSHQRFCPICDRAFEEGEAILRCEGCEVLHHPACWVRNQGCATEFEHRQTPIAEAYAARSVPRDPHPAEGTRVHRAAPPPPAAPAPHGFARQREVPVRSEPAENDDGPVIGDYDIEPSERQPTIGQPQRRRVTPPGDATPYRPTPPRRYQYPERQPVRQPLPKIYGRQRALDYWYVPAAIAVAVIVALGVIWAADRLFGTSDESDTPAIADIPTATATATPEPGEETPAGQEPPAQTGLFRPGDIVEVTGSGECLNVRPLPGLDNAPVACLPDGSRFEILGGPETTGDLTWWRVRTEEGEGWAAEDYLRTP